MKCTNLNILFCDWAPKLIIHKVIFIKSMNETLCVCLQHRHNFSHDALSCSTSSHWHQSFYNQQEVTVGVDEVWAARRVSVLPLHKVKTILWWEAAGRTSSCHSVDASVLMVETDTPAASQEKPPGGSSAGFSSQELTSALMQPVKPASDPSLLMISECDVLICGVFRLSSRAKSLTVYVKEWTAADCLSRSVQTDY